MPSEGQDALGLLSVPAWERRSSLSTASAPACQGPASEDLRWKWASSTILLAYGHVAASAKAHILPWVDNILSRMIFYFRYSSWVRAALPAGPSAPQDSPRAQGHLCARRACPPPHSHQALPPAAPSSSSTVLHALGKTPPHSLGYVGGGATERGVAPLPLHQRPPTRPHCPGLHWVAAMPRAYHRLRPSLNVVTSPFL